ncbi:hypothetical protein cgR_1894 [Corynebacterium glutamicum R]|uniref:Portal protein n=3 Tax=Corynebacterium glutamicum TaxID=1718 RepID=Q5KRF7_CORGT|nr:hypothetical protein [Corynebacterium glutamicum]BAF54889.1 hypothetical protein cgR_1894 [Corynebacterium glutamicum R]
MREQSAKIGQVESAFRKPIEQAKWELDPNGAPNFIVNAVSSDLRLPIKGQDGQVPRRNGKVSFDEHLVQGLDAVFTGVAFFEQVYEPRGGHERLRKLALRPNETIQRIHTAEDGGLVGITQRGINGRDDVFIPIDRLVCYSFQKSGASWEGRSVLRPAWKHYLEVHKLEALQSVVMQRNGLGHPVYTGSSLTDVNFRDAELAAGEEMAKSVSSGETDGNAVPAGASLDFKGTSGSLPDIGSVITHHNNQIALTVNATHLNLNNQGGSYGMAETMLGEFVNNLQSTASWFAKNFTQHVIEDLVSMTFPDYDGPVPMLQVPKIQMNNAVNLAVVGDLAAKGLITKEPNAESWVRSLLNMPAARPLKEAIEAKKYLREIEEENGVTLGDDPQPSATVLGRVKSLWKR